MVDHLIGSIIILHMLMQGVSITGRMSFDVLEQVQALVDLSGGSYLHIPTTTQMSKLFGHPCPGYPKVRPSYDYLLVYLSI